MDGIASHDRWILKLGAAAAVLGSLLGMVGNLIHPATPAGDPAGVARVIADSGSAWITIHVVIVFGIVLMLGGLVGIQHSIQGGLSGALAQFGLVAAIAGATVGFVLVILDGVAAPQLAEQWSHSPETQQPLAAALVSTNETLNFALASAFNFVFAGVTFILFGLAVATSAVYPRWLGWVVALAAVASIGAGLIQAYSGESTDASQILTIIGPTVITAWLLVMGILLWRRA